MANQYTPTPWHANTPTDSEDCSDVTIREPLYGAVVAIANPSLYDDGDIDPSFFKGNARLITASVNSYAKHCGPNAIQCAEDDLLGEALDLLQARRGLLDAERVLTHDEEDEYDALQRCLSRLPKQIT